MQISKVNNNRTGVKPTKSDFKGIMYHSPSKTNGLDNIETIVEKRIKTAQGLYSPINELKEKSLTDSEKQVGRILEQHFKSFKNKWENLTAQDIRNSIFKLEGTVSDMEKSKSDVRSCLKNSLSRDDRLVECITKLYIACLNDNKSLISEEDCSYIAEALNDDFCRKGKGRDIAKSLMHQDMVIQPEEMEDGTFMLSLSGKEGKQQSSKYKKNDRQALSDFLSMYAVIDVAARKDIRGKLRCLLILFIYGEQDVPKDGFDEWENHAKMRDVKDYIIDSIGELSINEAIEKLKNAKSEEKSSISKAYRDSLFSLLEKKNTDMYIKAIQSLDNKESCLKHMYFDDNNINKFWIWRFANSFAKIIRKASLYKPYMLEKGYISEKIWKDSINYVALKYIAIGKNVWNFTMEGIDDRDGRTNVGVIPDRLKTGISSFDFEMIKARETLQRDMALYVSFAANNYARAVLNIEESKEDFFLMKKELITQYKKKDAVKNTLMFFGGISGWTENNDDKEFISRYTVDDAETGMINDFHLMLYSIRNESFHFATMRENEKWNEEMVKRLFMHDANEMSNTVRRQYYSNNLPMFYSQEDLSNLMDKLYSKNNNRMSLIPSFRRVFVRSDFISLIKDKLKIHPSISAEEAEKWRNGLYFLLKEIYYNSFIVSDKSKKLFINLVNSDSFNRGGNSSAIKDFKGAVNSVRAFPLGGICQYIMTEQNRRNRNRRKVATSVTSEDKKYKHYSLLLEEGLRDAFVKFLDLNNDSSVYAFIKKIDVRPMPKYKDFLPGWHGSAFTELAKDLSNDPFVQKWYVMGRLLPSKQLNHLGGSVRNYIQFVNDIKKRAGIAGKDSLHICEDADKYDKVCLALDMCSKLSGTFSNNIDDYFDGEDDYAAFLKNYVKLGSDKNTELYEKYYDAVNPIPNRNIIMAKLYGCNNVLTNVVSHVTSNDLNALKAAEEKIKKYKESGKCNNIDEQKALIKYQKLNNKVELNVISSYSEIVNELLGQLINWSFMRERDLMYYQLGFHYLCLNNTSEKPGAYITIETKDGIVLNNAILYQIAAMYVNGLDLFVHVGSDGKVFENDKNGSVSAGGKIGFFTKFTKNIGYEDGDTLYEAGLELFENVNEHENIIDIRNYIDHFHYYNNESGRSILSLYSEIFDRFFSYSTGLRKNVPVVLTNILQRHFITARLSFGEGLKIVGRGKNKQEKPMALVSIKDNGLSSDMFTYKFGKTEVKIPAVSADFIKSVADILYYPEKAPGNLVNIEQLNKGWDNPKEKNKENNVTNENAKKNKEFSRKEKKEEKSEGDNEMTEKLKIAGFM